MKPWFTIDEIDDRTHIISEYRHWEETHCYLPEGYDVSTYEFFQGTPTRVLHDGDVIELGDRSIDVFHTPGHSPGHMCFWEASTGYLFTGDLVYKDTLFAYYPSTDPQEYLCSLEKSPRYLSRGSFPPIIHWI